MMPMIPVLALWLATAPKAPVFPPADGCVHHYPTMQAVVDLAKGRLAVAADVQARALGQAHLDTVVVTDSANRQRTWALADCLPPGVVVEAMELSPSGRDLIVTAYGHFDSEPARRQLMIATLPPDDSPLAFRAAVAADRWHTSQADADIDPDGTIYYVWGQVVGNVIGCGHLARYSEAGTQLLTDRGWVTLPLRYRTNPEGDLLIDGANVGRLVAGSRPTVAYDASGTPAGLFFEAAGDTGITGDDHRSTPMPAVFHVDETGRRNRVMVTGHAELEYTGLTGTDEFLHRTFAGSRPLAAFVRQGPMVGVPGGYEGSGDLVQVVPDAQAPGGFQLRLEWIRTSAVAFPRNGNPHAH